MSGQCIIVVGCRCTTMFVNGLMMLLFLFRFCLAEEEEEVGRVDHMQWHVHIYREEQCPIVDCAVSASRQ